MQNTFKDNNKIEAISVYFKEKVNNWSFLLNISFKPFVCTFYLEKIEILPFPTYLFNSHICFILFFCWFIHQRI